MRLNLLAPCGLVLAMASHSPLPSAKQQEPKAGRPAPKPSQSNSLAPETAINLSGETTVRRTLGKKTIEITLRAIQLKKSDAGFPPDLKDSYNELSLLQYVHVLVDGRSVVVPRSAFSDLFDVRTAWLASEKGLFVLSLGGGDASDLYVARIYFDSKVVHRRALFDANDQKQPVEETSYQTKITFID